MTSLVLRIAYRYEYRFTTSIVERIDAADPARMNLNRASEVSASTCLAMTCPPPHKKALQTAKMTAVAMMSLLYSIRVDLPVNRIARKDIRRSFL